ncbi:amino acid ABC transporter permease [Gluconacetobacter azotocaptans]|uniref:Glutamate/aspartate import permease protein GltK n=1 Tax=Gluconacetobacter azotocaptans TaxID=142834 RepID=A0A7W4JV63_9PROT|nr:amino acid ABC transporter permease [Gluconacetobacter azotocaptans]MBB2191439.1 amino acid ABC transporter permease [Gluconacetobacter azotocaptans]GBQ29660.1 amino acid ABC transporter permease [Gluconacetobacter azotocaptans DSM 13594]
MIDWNFMVTYSPRLLKACEVTFGISVTSLALSTVAGLGIALLRLSPRRILSSTAWIYVWIVRGTPLLLQLFAIYYAMPMTGLRLDPWTAGILTLSLNSSAYFSEIFRSAIQSIPTGQTEAAIAIGMGPLQTLRRIVIPLSLRPALPPYVGQAITLLKNSSLVSIIAVPDLMQTAQSIYSTTFKVVEVMLMTGVLYLIMTSLLQIAQTSLERRLSYYTVK